MSARMVEIDIELDRVGLIIMAVIRDINDKEYVINEQYDELKRDKAYVKSSYKENSDLDAYNAKIDRQMRYIESSKVSYADKQGYITGKNAMVKYLKTIITSYVPRSGQGIDNAVKNIIKTYRDLYDEIQEFQQAIHADKIAPYIVDKNIEARLTKRVGYTARGGDERLDMVKDMMTTISKCHIELGEIIVFVSTVNGANIYGILLQICEYIKIVEGADDSNIHKGPVIAALRLRYVRYNDLRKSIMNKIKKMYDNIDREVQVIKYNKVLTYDTLNQHRVGLLKHHNKLQADIYAVFTEIKKGLDSYETVDNLGEFVNPPVVTTASPVKAPAVSTPGKQKNPMSRFFSGIAGALGFS